MTHYTDTLERTTRRIAMLAVPLVIAAAGTATAYGGGGNTGGMMGGGGWGLFGAGMGLWGLVWMGLLIAVPLYLVYSLLDSDSGGDDSQPLSVLRERYARGELTDEEFERRRKQLDCRERVPSKTTPVRRPRRRAQTSTPLDTRSRQRVSECVRAPR